MAAERLATSIRTMLVDAGRSGGSAFERDAAVVLRRVEQTARTAHANGAADSRAYFKLLDRVLAKLDDARSEAAPRGQPSGVALDTAVMRPVYLVVPCVAKRVGDGQEL